MLTNDDLVKIRDIFDERIELKLETKLEAMLEAKLEAKFEVKLAPINVRLTAIEKSIVSMQKLIQHDYGRIIYLEERMSRVETRLQLPPLKPSTS